MGLESIKEGATEPVLPLIGETDLSVGLLVALFVGFMLMALIRPAGENAADVVAQKMSDVIGVNPQTGETGGNTAPLGGA